MPLLLVALFACGSPEPEASPAPVEAAKAAPVASFDPDDPTSCAPCHGQVVSEWQTSMHSQAHHDRDPIYGAMRTLRMAKQGEAVGGKCLTCHTPRAPEAPDSAAAQAGVSCATCHAAAEVHADRGPGAKALVFDDTVFRSARDVAPGASPVHGTGPAAPHLADGRTMCLACHDATTTPADQPACTTGPEHEALAGDGTCVSCHMPRVDGPSGAVSGRADHPSHAFLGPHQAWSGDASFLASAVDLTVALEGRTATVTLTNQAGHAFPTGFPGRMAVLVVKGLDAGGATVWSNVPEQGLPEPAFLLNKVYVDADGKPVAAPFAKELKADRRLVPGEVRPVTVEVPAGVVAVEAELVFRLLPPPLAKALKVDALDIATPRGLGAVRSE